MGNHVLPPERYVALLRAAGAAVDLWQTIYHQQLAGPDAVLDWVRGTTLLPVQAALGGAGSVQARWSSSRHSASGCGSPIRPMLAGPCCFRSGGCSSSRATPQSERRRQFRSWRAEMANCQH